MIDLNFFANRQITIDGIINRKLIICSLQINQLKTSFLMLVHTANAQSSTLIKENKSSFGQLLSSYPQSNKINKKNDEKLSSIESISGNSKKETNILSQKILENQDINKNSKKIQQPKEFAIKTTQALHSETKMDQNDTQYLRFQNYSFRKLNSKHRAQALKLLTKTFIQDEPLAKSFYKQYPEEKLGAYEYWQRYWEMQLDDTIQSGNSIAVVDLTNKEELIGVQISKHSRFSPQKPDLDAKFLNGFTILSCETQLRNKLIQKASPEVQEILYNCQFIGEALAAAIKYGDTGKSLFSKISPLAEKIGKQKGYMYSICLSSNVMTAGLLKKLGMTKISELDCRQFQHLGQRPYAFIDEQNRTVSLWLKRINNPRAFLLKASL